jgi:hypothetical protein
MTQKLNRNQREYLKQLVLESQLSRLSTSEALNFIEQKLGVLISERYYFQCKRMIEDDAKKRLTYFTKTRSAYLHEFYERIHEIEFLQKKHWELHDKHAAAADNNNAKLQLDCIKELRLLSVTLADLYNMLPLITGFEFESVSRGVGGIILRGNNHINWTEAERKGLDDPSLSDEAKF